MFSGQTYLTAARVGVLLAADGFITFLFAIAFSEEKYPPRWLIYPVVLPVVAGIIIQVGVAVAAVRFLSTSQKAGRRQMMKALFISAPCVFIAIVLAFLILITYVY